MARGYPGAFGRKVNALVGLDPAVRCCSSRRSSTSAGRSALLHLDLLALLSLLGLAGVLQPRAASSASVPLAYPPLLYLLVRMLVVAARGAPAPAQPLRLLVPVGVAGASASSSWSASAIGPERHRLERDRRRLRGRDRRRQLVHGEPLYGHVPVATTSTATRTGPVNYEAYVPVRAAVRLERRLGRPAGRARRGDRLRPAAAGCCCSCSAGACAGRRWDRARLRVGGVPVHALRAEQQLQRRARRRRSCSPRCSSPASSRAAPRRARGARRPDEVRAAGARAAARDARRRAARARARRCSAFAVAFVDRRRARA